MKKLLRPFVFFFVVGITGILSFHPLQLVQAAPDDSALLKQGVATWAKGWSSGDSRFTMSRVDDLYDKSDRFLEFDTLSPADTVLRGYRNFQAVWEPTMQASTNANTAVDDNVVVTTDGKMGLTTFTFRTQFTDRKTGKKYDERAHASMVWEKQNGRWVIIHEHISNPIRTS